MHLRSLLGDVGSREKDQVNLIFALKVHWVMLHNVL